MLKKILPVLGSTTSVLAILCFIWYLFARSFFEFFAIIVSLMFYLMSSAC